MIDELIGLFFEYWWIWFIVIPLIILYLYWSNKKSFAGLSVREMGVVLEIGLYILLIYLVQKYLFPEHNYFLIAIPIFCIIWGLAVALLLAGRNYYMMVTTFEGQEFYETDPPEKIISPNTSHRLLVMDEGVYRQKKHVGDLNYQLWRGSERVKFADYFNEKTGTFHHPRIPQLHNVTFYAMKSFWVKMRHEVPELIDQNILLTWLFNWRLSYKMDAMKDRFELHLRAIEKQHEYRPFGMPDTIEELARELYKEKQQTPERTELVTMQQVEQTVKADKDSGEGSDGV